jgi:hypothetical protein
MDTERTGILVCSDITMYDECEPLAASATRLRQVDDWFDVVETGPADRLLVPKAGELTQLSRSGNPRYYTLCKDEELQYLRVRDVSGLPVVISLINRDDVPRYVLAGKRKPGPVCAGDGGAKVKGQVEKPGKNPHTITLTDEAWSWLASQGKPVGDVIEELIAEQSGE